MKVDSTDFGVFTAEVSKEDAAAWLLGDKPELLAVNGAIDDAASHAGDYGQSFIIIKIAKSADEQTAPEGDNDPNGNRDLAREIDGS